MAGVSDPYRQLGVPRSATLSQIKAAHRALAKRYHPDSPTADAQRFLRVQEAYQLLSDPLRRREWDARHSPAPMRADEPAPPRPRGRGRRTPPGRERAARNYTWSASEVPWWEDSARDGRSSRPRQATDEPAGGRPAAGRPAEGRPADGRPSGGRPATGRPATGRPASGRPAGGSDVPPPAPEAPPADFDVYNRSSGAAWSAAARAYFRRADQDLPRRGSFHYQGTQPLTAARARMAAEESRRRGAPTAGRSPGQMSGAAAPAAPPSPAAGSSASQAQPTVGVARDAEAVAEVRARVREQHRAAAWPMARQRLLYALLAWLPPAVLISYGAPLGYDCQPALGNCPPWLAPVQIAAAGLLLGALLALPKLAYLAGLATTALAVAGGALMLGAWLVGVRAPQLAALPPWALALGALVLVGGYLLAGLWLLFDPARRPWVAALRPLRGVRAPRSVAR